MILEHIGRIAECSASQGSLEASCLIYGFAFTTKDALFGPHPPCNYIQRPASHFAVDGDTDQNSRQSGADAHAGANSAAREPATSEEAVARLTAELEVEWYIELFLSVHFAANWVSVHEGFLEGK